MIYVIQVNEFIGLKTGISGIENIDRRPTRQRKNTWTATAVQKEIQERPEWGRVPPKKPHIKQSDKD